MKTIEQVKEYSKKQIKKYQKIRKVEWELDGLTSMRSCTITGRIKGFMDLLDFIDSEHTHESNI